MLEVPGKNLFETIPQILVKCVIFAVNIKESFHKAFTTPKPITCEVKEFYANFFDLLHHRFHFKTLWRGFEKNKKFSNYLDTIYSIKCLLTHTLIVTT